MIRKFRKLGALEQRLTVLCLVLFAAFLGLFMRLPERIAAMEKQRKYEGEFYEYSQLFSEIYGSIKDRYVDEVDSKALFESSIRGMFAALDPHSQWLPPDSLTQLEKDTEGEFSGVGLHITLQDGILTVIAPIPGSPAARAGLHPMDKIVQIEGKSTEGLSLVEAVKKLTGPTGTEVSIKVFREGESDLLDYKLVRETIKVDSVYHKIIDNEIGYVRITKFAEETGADVKKALKEFNKEKVKGIIVDLRYDSGGLLDEAVEICDYFLPAGQVIVSTKGRKPENSRTYKALQGAICEVPMVVLVNKGSASASEIFAGAMQDTKRGFIISPEGEKTYGKGSVQTISYLKHSLERDDNDEPRLNGMRLTTAKYYTPSGRSIHGTGITADFEVPMTMEQKTALLRHGLYGDPDTTKLVEEREAAAKKRKAEKQGSKAEPKKDEEPKAEADKDEKADDAKAKPTEDPSKPPADVQLDEGIKYLKMTLMIKDRMPKS